MGQQSIRQLVLKFYCLNLQHRRGCPSPFIFWQVIVINQLSSSVKVVKEYTDFSCLLQLQADDANGLNQLFDRYATKLSRFAYGYLQSYDDAEEIVQECFMKLWELRNTFDEHIVFKTYLYTTARNLVLNQLRRQRYWTYEDYREETVLDEHSPSQELEQQELTQFYQDALAQLSPRRRQMFALSRQEGLSNSAIAKEMDVSVKCVENQITLALKFIRGYFKAHDLLLALIWLLLAY